MHKKVNKLIQKFLHFSTRRGWRLRRICFVLNGLRYVHTASPLTPRIYGTLANRKIRDKGQVLVEFIFVVLVFLFFVFGILQLTLLVNASNLLGVAAYVSNRGATHPYKHTAQAPEKQILQPIWDDLKPFGSNQRYDVAHEPWLWDTDFGDKLKTTLTIHYTGMPVLNRKYIVLKASSTSFKEGTCR